MIDCIFLKLSDTRENESRLQINLHHWMCIYALATGIDLSLTFHCTKYGGWEVCQRQMIVIQKWMVSGFISLREVGPYGFLFPSNTSVLPHHSTQ